MQKYVVILFWRSSITQKSYDGVYHITASNVDEAQKSAQDICLAENPEAKYVRIKYVFLGEKIVQSILEAA